MNTQTVEHTRRERLRFLWQRRRLLSFVFLTVALSGIVVSFGEIFYDWPVSHWRVFFWGATMLTFGILCLQDWREGVRDMPYVTSPSFAWMSIVVGGVMVLIFILARVGE